MSDKNVFATRLKTARRDLNMTQRKLSGMIGYSTQSIANYERGANEPNFVTLVQIADILGVSVDWLVGKELNVITSDTQQTIIDLKMLGGRSQIPLFRRINKDASGTRGEFLGYIGNISDDDFIFATPFTDEVCFPEYNMGDIAFVNEAKSYKDGDLICISNGNNSFIRKYMVIEGVVFFVAVNPSYKKLEMDETHVILGRVDACIKKNINA